MIVHFMSLLFKSLFTEFKDVSYIVRSCRIDPSPEAKFMSRIRNSKIAKFVEFSEKRFFTDVMDIFMHIRVFCNHCSNKLSPFCDVKILRKTTPRKYLEEINNSSVLDIVDYTAEQSILNDDQERWSYDLLQ